MPLRSFVVVVGFAGRMSQLVRAVLQERSIELKVFSSKAPPELKIDDFRGSAGVIDFSQPEATEKILKMAVEAKVPLVCGTTGFSDRSAIERRFRESAQSIPIVWDSNFSLGVEVLCQLSERAAQRLMSSAAITDIHHIHKKDAPSGTALKIQDRIKASASVSTTIESIRIGEVFGEHKVSFTNQDETIEIVHKAHSRKPFASGAVSALEWASQQRPGFYTMKEVLQ